MKSLPDYYAILGVPKSASMTQIKHAYRKLASVHHPDKAGSHGQITLINEAYATLKDPKKRAEYDVYHAMHFGAMAKMTDKASKISQALSPAVMTRIKDLEHELAHRAKHFAKQHPELIRHAKRLFDKLSTLIDDKPTLMISKDIAMTGGQIYFYHNDRHIRTTLPCGLTDGSQIKLTIDGVGVWFVVKIG